LKFNSGVPVNDNSFVSKFSYESCAIQNDASGNMLFYSNGKGVWNSLHSSITTTALLGNESTKCGVLIVPNPAVNNQYYIFTQSAS
jgi:hypothetical protein